MAGSVSIATVRKSERLTLFDDHYDLVEVAAGLVPDEALDVLDVCTDRFVGRCKWLRRLPRSV